MERVSGRPSREYIHMKVAPHAIGNGPNDDDTGASIPLDCRYL